MPARSPLSGPAAVLDELHPRVRWRAPVIELHKEKEYDMHLRGRPLVLIPLVFARSVLMGVSEGQRAVAIGYQARGTAELWAPGAAGSTTASTSSSVTAARRCSARSTGPRRRPSSPPA